MRPGIGKVEAQTHHAHATILLCRLANWGKAAAVRFAPSGDRFAAVGEGGVVATWRLDAPTRQVLTSSIQFTIVYCLNWQVICQYWLLTSLLLLT